MQTFYDVMFVLTVLFLEILFAPMTIASRLLGLPSKLMGRLFLEDMKEIYERMTSK